MEERMEFKITILDDTREEIWDNLVNSSPFGTIFHTVDWLKIVKKHSDAEFLPIMVYNGTQLIAIYPVFVVRHGFIKLARSPPSGALILYLGPVIAGYGSMDQPTKEKVYFRIQQAVDNYLFNTVGCRYVRIRSPPGVFDSRPLQWSGYSVEPFYTYRIDLTKGIERIWEDFDRKLRVDINKTIRAGMTIRQGVLEDLEFIQDLLDVRYLQQGLLPVDYRKYLRDLYERFYPENLKIFVVEYNGKRVGGTINLVFNNGMFLWVGVPKTEMAGVSPNDLVQWEAIKWAQANGLAFYEEMDAGDDPRLRHFKSKYNPGLSIWYVATKYSSVLFEIGVNIYRLFRRQ